jgi:hypothetical protein
MQIRRPNKEQRNDIAALAAMKDSDIDLTDMPEVLDWRGAEVGRYYRKKKTIARLRTERKRNRIR